MVVLSLPSASVLFLVTVLFPDPSVEEDVLVEFGLIISPDPASPGQSSPVKLGAGSGSFLYAHKARSRADISIVQWILRLQWGVPGEDVLRVASNVIPRGAVIGSNIDAI